MIDKKHGLPMARQAKLLAMSRSSIYYRPQPASESDLRLELHLEHPFAGARIQRLTAIRPMRLTSTSASRRSPRRLKTR